MYNSSLRSRKPELTAAVDGGAAPVADGALVSPAAAAAPAIVVLLVAPGNGRGPASVPVAAGGYVDGGVHPRHCCDLVLKGELMLGHGGPQKSLSLNVTGS